MLWVVVAITALLAGLLQGTIGFGGGVFMMMFFPAVFPLGQAAAINGAIAFFLNCAMVLVYRKHIRFKMVLPVFLYCIVLSSITIHYAAGANQALIKLLFGIFLVLMSIYYMFIKKDGRPAPMNLFVSLVFLTISAVCDGLFAICGPTLAVYYLSRCEEHQEYLANLTVSFLLLGGYNTCFRVFTGIIQPTDYPYILLGAAMIVTGGLIAKRIADRMNKELLMKLIYVMIFVSGVNNLL